MESSNTSGRASFGASIRAEHFLFDRAYVPLNHGSYGAFPKAVRDHQRALQDSVEAQTDPFIRFSIPALLDQAREAIAPLLGASTGEVVYVPNATTAVNVVLRNLAFAKRDVILYFNTTYGACEKTVKYICESTEAEAYRIELVLPLEDHELVDAFRDAVSKVKGAGNRPRIALLDTVVTFPGVRMPWEALVEACRDLEVLSLIDGAHGVGHIDLTHLGRVSPDFFTSNCYK